MTSEDWRQNYIFSDECSVEKGAGKKRSWAFGYPSEKWEKDRIETYSKGKQASLMVWGCIGRFGVSELVVMARDEFSPRGGYSAQSYTDTLEFGLLEVYEGQTFVQDNAPVHTARYMQDWLNQNWIKVLPNWPPYSPDLNPIEHLWARLKELLYNLHPELDSVHSKEEQLRLLTNWLPEVWQQLKPEWIDAVLNSMPDRLQAVIDANGWQTKY